MTPASIVREPAKHPIHVEPLQFVEPAKGWRKIGSAKQLAIFIGIVFVVAAIRGLAPPGEWYAALLLVPY